MLLGSVLWINIYKGVEEARWGRGSKLNGDVVQPRPQLVLQVVLELQWLFRFALNGNKAVGPLYLLDRFGLSGKGKGS